MRLAQLYMRSRVTGPVVVCIGGVALIAWLWSRTYLQVPVGQGNESASVPLLFFIPLASAAVIGVSAGSPFGEVEHVASRSLPALRFCHLLGLLTWATTTLVLAAHGWEQPHVELVLTRNLLGFAGIALLGGCVFGCSLSWVLPFAFAALAFRLGMPAPNAVALWAWPLQPPENGVALAVALLLGAAGLSLISLYGGRRSRSEAD